MESALNIHGNCNHAEIGILAKWLLHETWQTILQAVEQRLVAQKIDKAEKEKLQTLYTSFFFQAFYSPVRTTGDVHSLLKHTREMLLLLKNFDEPVWLRLMVENKLQE